MKSLYIIWMPVYTLALILNIAYFWGFTIAYKQKNKRVQESYKNYFVVCPMIFNSPNYNKVAFKKTFAPMLTIFLISMPIILLAYFIPYWIHYGSELDILSTLGLITWIAIFITFIIIYFVFYSIWKKHFLAKQLKVSDGELIQEYYKFKNYINNQERPDITIDELSTNKLFRIRNRTSKQDMEKNIKRALHSKNQMAIIYVLFDSLNTFEWSRKDKIVGLDVGFTNNNYQLIILKDFFDTVALG